ncbi:MAG: type II toxin-antitoxin system RelB/DinJ family antitoxin [Eubacteriales bacterium]
MANTTTLNLRVNPLVKKQAEEILSELGIPMSTAINMYLRQIKMTGGIPFSIELPKVPSDINADLMTNEELYFKLERGYADYENGRVTSAAEAFSKLREKHSI